MTFSNKIKLFDYIFDHEFTVAHYTDRNILFSSKDNRQYRAVRDDGEYKLNELGVALPEQFAEEVLDEIENPSPRIKRFSGEDEPLEGDEWKNN